VLFGRVIRIADSSPQGRFIGPLTHSIDGRIAVQGLMRAMPIVMVDPQRELVANIGCLRVGCSPELLEGCPLCSLDLSVQVRRAWRDRPEPNGLIHQTPLDFFSEKLGPPVRLESLDRERHLLQHLVEKPQR
jgi:hypothetical protein